MAKTNSNAIVIKPFDICEAVVLLDVYLFGKENNRGFTRKCGWIKPAFMPRKLLTMSMHMVG